MGLFNFFRNTADINTGVAEYETNDGAVLLDVRTLEEYRDGHIDGSINIPLDRISSVENTVKDKSTPLYVYCLSGGRSGQAVSYLKQIGYTNAKSIGVDSSIGKDLSFISYINTWNKLSDFIIFINTNIFF